MPTHTLLQPVEFGVNPGETPCHPLSRGDFRKILSPRAFFWFRGKLFVGYNWLSSLHMEEEPVWDPSPVRFDTRIETCNGYIDFCEIKTEGPPYYRKYAVLRLTYRYKPDDSGSGNPAFSPWWGKTIDQGCVEIDEQHVLFPNCYMQLAWNNGPSGFGLISPLQYEDHQADLQVEDKRFELQKKVGHENLPRRPKRKHWGFYTPDICMCHKWVGDGENRLRRILRSPSLDTMRFDPRAVAIRKEEHPTGCLHCH